MAAAGMLAAACPAAILAQPISAGWHENLPELMLRADIPGRNVDLMSKKAPTVTAFRWVTSASPTTNG
ncbi:MAG: hypothetical protein BVN32_08825 [Proteobacteria bacterium ST_bin14]|nr:MAG: hypothetical protein BVN32_08825 [Proteobacteria bacterium ST_bin14]